MAIASSPFSPKSWLDRFRSPVFIASVLSLGAHGVFFAAMPMLSASEDLQDKEESVPVVALSAEEAQRLPDAVTNNGANAFNGFSPFFGDNPLVSQEGESLLPVPGIPPYGDLNGLDSSFNDPLQTTPPLWGNPVDIFQASLPEVPSQTSIIFPETNTSSSDPFNIPLSNSSTINNTVALNNNNPPAVLPETPPIVIPKAPEAPIDPKDEPLLAGTEEIPEPGFEAPIVAPEEGTTTENALGSAETSPDPVDRDALASNPQNDDEATPDPVERNDLANELEGANPLASESAPEDSPPATAINSLPGYTRDGSVVAAEGYQLFANAGNLTDQLNASRQPDTEEFEIQKNPPNLVEPFPDPDYQCPADAQPAKFSLVINYDGSILELKSEQNTGYAALDTAAEEAIRAAAVDLTEHGVYLSSVTFEDQAGLCAVPEVLS